MKAVATFLAVLMLSSGSLAGAQEIAGESPDDKEALPWVVHAPEFADGTWSIAGTAPHGSKVTVTTDAGEHETRTSSEGVWSVDIARGAADWLVIRAADSELAARFPPRRLEVTPVDLVGPEIRFDVSGLTDEAVEIRTKNETVTSLPAGSDAKELRAAIPTTLVIWVDVRSPEGDLLSREKLFVEWAPVRLTITSPKANERLTGPFAIEGRTEPRQRVMLFDGGFEKEKDTWADESGFFSIEPPTDLGRGEHRFIVVAKPDTVFAASEEVRVMLESPLRPPAYVHAAYVLGAVSGAAAVVATIPAVGGKLMVTRSDGRAVPSLWSTAAVLSGSALSGLGAMVVAARPSRYRGKPAFALLSVLPATATGVSLVAAGSALVTLLDMGPGLLGGSFLFSLGQGIGGLIAISGVIVGVGIPAYAFLRGSVLNRVLFGTPSRRSTPDDPNLGLTIGPGRVDLKIRW